MKHWSILQASLRLGQMLGMPWSLRVDGKSTPSQLSIEIPSYEKEAYQAYHPLSESDGMPRYS